MSRRATIAARSEIIQIEDENIDERFESLILIKYQTKPDKALSKKPVNFDQGLKFLIF